METRNPRRWWILIVLCLSSLVLVVDTMALTVAVPRMTADLHASAQDTQWILDSYILVFAGLLLTSGGLGDRFGRRKVMIIGLLLFGAASLAATFAASPGQVIAVRVLMGIGGALIMPSTLSILITVFDAAERPKAMAAWTSVAMVGMVGSPVLGGVLIARFSWHAIFFINVPVVALAVVAGLVLMPESKGPWQRPDPIGAVLSAAGLTALVWWIIGIPARDAFGAGQAVTLAVAVLALAGFVVWENVTTAPMVPLVLFKQRNFSGGSVSLALLQIGTGGLLLVLTQYLQFVLGWSPVKAGLAFVPMALCVAVFAMIAPRVQARAGAHRTVAAGMLLMVIGLILFAGLGLHAHYTSLLPGFMLFGAGAGLMNVPLTNAVMAATPAAQAGIASALLNASREVAGLLGITVIGAVLSTRRAAALRSGADPAHAFLDGYHTGLLVTIALMAAGVVVSYLTLRPRAASAPLPSEPMAELTTVAEIEDVGESLGELVVPDAR